VRAVAATFGDNGRMTASARFVRSGVVAGVTATVGFTLLHDLVISDIWAMLPIMAIAGAICGACLGWSYARLFAVPSVGGWLGYNAAYIVMFGLLGAVSVVVFEPVTTMAAILERGGPVDDLIVQALPMTLAFTLATAALISLVFGRGWRQFGAVLATTSVLVFFLGLNVSAIGLVEFAEGGLYLVAEMFGLVAAIGVMFILMVLVLERQILVGSGR
jgi:hypothetical protein